MRAFHHDDHGREYTADCQGKERTEKKATKIAEQRPAPTHTTTSDWEKEPNERTIHLCMMWNDGDEMRCDDFVTAVELEERRLFALR